MRDVNHWEPTFSGLMWAALYGQRTAVFGDEVRMSLGQRARSNRVFPQRVVRLWRVAARKAPEGRRFLTPVSTVFNPSRLNAEAVPVNTLEVLQAWGEKRLPTEIGLCLFRVLQQALDNAAKHSGVKRIEVKLQEESGNVTASISRVPVPETQFGKARLLQQIDLTTFAVHELQNVLATNGPVEPIVIELIRLHAAGRYGQVIKIMRTTLPNKGRSPKGKKRNVIPQAERPSESKAERILYRVPQDTPSLSKPPILQ